MADGAAEERQMRVVPRLEHRRQETASLPIPDELLLDIFLRLSNPADLIRASASCVSFRRLVADRSFLRRYRKLHAPPLLGFLDFHTNFHPAASPHPSAPAATAVALAADFSFSFLPAPTSDWFVQDIRDGRVLLNRSPAERDIRRTPRYKVVFKELVVCDPLYRRYLILPPIPAHLAATLERPPWRIGHRCCESFLAPPGADDEDASSVEDTSFSVIWMAQCETEMVAFFFHSSTGQWRAISSQSWSDLFPSIGRGPLFSYRQYAYGYFYWVTTWREYLLVLDTRRMEFSIAEPPLEVRGFLSVPIAIVEAGEGRPGMFWLEEDDLNYTIRRNSCGSSNQWQFEKKIALNSRHSFSSSTGMHLLLYQQRNPSLDAACFSLDIKTLQLERVFVSNSCRPSGHTYTNFPPSLLSTPTISSGFGKRGSEEDA